MSVLYISLRVFQEWAWRCWDWTGTLGQLQLQGCVFHRVVEKNRKPESALDVGVFRNFGKSTNLRTSFSHSLFEVQRVNDD